MLQYNLAAGPDEPAYIFPRLQMLRVPACCSAGNLFALGSVFQPKRVGDPKKLPKYKGAGPETLSALIAARGVLSREGYMVMTGWLLSHRVTQSEHPANAFPAWNVRSAPNTPEPGRYHWPSRLWAMYDRTDTTTVQKETYSGIAAWGRWMEENSQDMGITTTIVDAESVHAKGQFYTSFGSEKPDGHGTIRTWILSVDDFNKLDQWRKDVLEMVNQQFDVDPNAQEVNLW